MKPREGAIANRYAHALFLAAKQEGCLPEVRENIAGLGDVWKDHPEYVLLLLNPRLTKAKVVGMLDALLDKMQAHVVTKRFIHLLLEKDRLSSLPSMVPSFERLWRINEGEIDVIVTTALPISDPLQKEVITYLSRKSGMKPVVQWKQDPSILGGLIVQWPDKVFDGSLARKLDVLKDRMSEGV